MSNLYDLLQRIKEKPKMYLLNCSIIELYMFLMGYRFARAELKVPLTRQEIEFYEFQQWIQNKYNILSTITWAKIILDNSNNEIEALDKFFYLFEEFKQEINKTLKK